MPFAEHHKRSASKAVTFRVLIVVSDIFVIYAITRKVSETIALLVYTNLVGTLLYYGHERYWNRIKWGKLRHHKK